MKKADRTKKTILDYISNNPGVSNTQIAKYIWLTTVAVLYHLQELLKDDFIYKVWNTRAVRYFLKEKKFSINIPEDFFSKIKLELSEEYDWIDDLDISILLENILAIVKPDWTWVFGIEAFIEKIKKENNETLPSEDLLSERLKSFLLSFFEEERKRRKNGFFDGTQSLEYIINHYNHKVYIDKLLFTGIATLPHFGRLRQATELFYWKQDQNKFLLEKAISYSIDTIINYIIKNNIYNFVFTPPTLKRQVQFRDVLKEILVNNGINFNELKAEKVKTDILHTLRPQKELKGKDRIINAESSIVVWDIWENISEIIIFDDNFTTGATINSIAWKLKNNGFTWKITSITITWNFEYIPWITDVWEI